MMPRRLARESWTPGGSQLLESTEVIGRAGKIHGAEVLIGRRTRLLALPRAVLTRSAFFPALALVLFALDPARGQQLIIEPGAVASFEITAPSVARVGDAVAIRVVARDASGNTVRNYDKSGGAITLGSSSMAGRVVEPDRFAASAFHDGILDAEVTLTRAGSYELAVEDASAHVSSRTGRIDVRPGDVATVKVMPPQEARVGEGFDVVIELYDRFGNAVADYDRFGAEARIKQGLAGSVGRFEPASVSPSIFSQGRATVRVRYSQAENAVMLVEAGTARGLSSPINVRAGDLDRFVVTVPSRKVIAGEPFGIVVEARDAGGNTITDFNRVGGVVSLRTTGSGHIEPSSIPPTAFASGIAMVNVRYNVAEKIGIIAEDPTGAKRGESAEKVDVAGGQLGRIEVIPAENARAGAPLATQILGYDIYGNFIRDYSGRNLRIVITAADASPVEAPVVTASTFRDGVAIVAATPVRAGALILQAVDEVTGAGGRSAPVRVRAGIVASFTVRTPLAAVAHEPFEAEITALDRFGNVVDDYARVGAGITIDRPGQGEISPASIPPSAFVEGVARVNLTYNMAEEIAIGVTEQGGTARGKSGPVVVTHSAPKRFIVKAGTFASVGEPFRVTVTAADDFGNPVVSYSAMNRTISLYSENGDPVAPPVFASAAFKRGVAELDAVFFRTGDAVLVAEEVGGAVTGKSGVVRVMPGRPAQLVVTAPSTSEAGAPLPVRIEVKDRLGNRIRDYSPAASSLAVKVTSPNGAMMPDNVSLGDISRMVFREGVAEVSVLPKTVGEIVFEVRDEMMNIGGRSPVVKVTAGPVDHFQVENLTQGGLRAGEPMKLRVTALDAFGNVVADYGKDGSGARLSAQVRTASGMAPASGVFVPSTLRGSSFVEGRAEIYALYDKAEAVEVAVDRIAAGATVRPEVVAAAAAERAGGSLISIIGNSPLAVGDARRLTESLLELTIPGAILSSKGTGVVRQSGIVSLVTLTQMDEGVRVLIHAMGPAVMRAGTDANRVVIDVDPVIGGASMREPVLVPSEATPAVAPSTTPRGSAPAMTPTPAAPASAMADVDRLVRENRFGEALTIVNGLIEARPDDVSLQNLKRRLETLATIMKSVPPAAPQPAPQNQSLQPTPQAIQNPAAVPMPTPPAPSGTPAVVPPAPMAPQNGADMASIEAAVRAGKYRDALTILDRYLSAHPQDSSAARMKTRIEQMIKILDGQQ